LAGIIGAISARDWLNQRWPFAGAVRTG